MKKVLIGVLNIAFASKLKAQFDFGSVQYLKTCAMLEFRYFVSQGPMSFPVAA